MKYSKHISLISISGDLLIMNVFFNLGFCYLNGFSKVCFEPINLLFFVFINLAWVVSANIFKAYKIDRQVFKKEILSTYIKIIVFFFFLFLLFFQVFTFSYYSRDDIKYLFAIFLAAIIIWKFILYYTFLLYRKTGRNYRNVVIIGYGDTADELKKYFSDNSWLGYIFKGFFTDKKPPQGDIIGGFNDIEEFILNNKIDEIYIMLNDLKENVYKSITAIISKSPTSLRFVPDLSEFSYMSLKLINYDMVPVMKIQQGPLSFLYNRIVKRLFDIVISIVAILLILSWLIPLLALIDLFTDRNGLFFVQKRSGLNNKPFNLIKFKTMKKNNDANLKQATENDVRVTKLGNILRKTSIDELPQFFNVLGGTMSVIGPRPHMLKHTNDYKEIVNKFMIRHTVKPGITGYAQVQGHRGEIKKVEDIKGRIRFDITYIENWSLGLDFKIIFLTVFNLMKRDKKAY